MDRVIAPIAAALGISSEMAYLLTGVVIGVVLARLLRARAERSLSGPLVSHTAVRTTTPIHSSIQIPGASVELQGAELAEVLDMMQNGNMIGAIKIIREKTGLGLKESKDIADALQRAQGR